MKSVKQKWRIVVIMILVLGVLWFGIYWYYSHSIAKSGKAFMKSLPQLSRIDTSKQVCFELSEEWWHNSVIDCFVPDDFDKHTAGIEDLGKYKEAMKSSKVLNVQPIEEVKKSEFLKFYDDIQPVSGHNNYLSTKKEISEKVKTEKATKLDYEKNIYLLSLEGYYKEAQNKRNEYCLRFQIDCKGTAVSYILQGKVLSWSGSPIPWVIVRVVGGGETTKTDTQGMYTLPFSTFPQKKVRIEAYKPGFSNAFHALDILSPVTKQSGSKDFTLETPVQFAIIDTVRHTITGKDTSVDGKNFIIKTKWSQYSIPFDALVHKDGSLFRGTTTAYFFEFDKHSMNADLLRNDIFDSVVGYAGNLMKTFGMPYVLFVTDEGETIHVLKSKPMVLRSQISEMNALRTNQDRIYEPLTDKDMQFLVDESKRLGWYPIDREFLIKNKLLRYPVFWVFDQTKGIWVNQGANVISVQGISEVLFYTISDIQK